MSKEEGEGQKSVRKAIPDDDPPPRSFCITSTMCLGVPSLRHIKGWSQILLPNYICFGLSSLILLTPLRLNFRHFVSNSDQYCFSLSVWQFQSFASQNFAGIHIPTVLLGNLLQFSIGILRDTFRYFETLRGLISNKTGNIRTPLKVSNLYCPLLPLL